MSTKKLITLAVVLLFAATIGVKFAVINNQGAKPKVNLAQPRQLIQALPTAI